MPRGSRRDAPLSPALCDAALGWFGAVGGEHHHDASRSGVWRDGSPLARPLRVVPPPALKEGVMSSQRDSNVARMQV